MANPRTVTLTDSGTRVAIAGNPALASLPRITANVPTGADTAPTRVGDLPHRLFSVGTGPQSFNVASGFAGNNLVFSITDAPDAADFDFDGVTADMVVQTLVPASGDVIIRATNSAGFVEQSFPLFVYAAAEYTVLAREANGTVTVESIAPPRAIRLVRESDGSVTVQEVAQ
jgi:hypothetical protein